MLTNCRTGRALATKVTLRRRAWELALGLMFRREIGEDEAMVFCLPRSGIREASVHMLFVPFPIALLWLDEERRVVDKTLARPWRTGYRPRKAARYFVEAHPSRLDLVQGGDQLRWQ
jgi:uncharacterized membrane protein (UPF0127 family)